MEELGTETQGELTVLDVLWIPNIWPFNNQFIQGVMHSQDLVTYPEKLGLGPGLNLHSSCQLEN